MSISCRFPSHRDAQAAKWFSRRHETNAAHQDAQTNWQADQELRRERELASLAATKERKRKAGVK